MREHLLQRSERVAHAIEPPVEALSTWVKNEQPNIHVDETPWPVLGSRNGCGLLPIKLFVCFTRQIHAHVWNSKNCSKGEYRGVLSSDDFSVYNGYCAAAQQKCLAHLRRHFLRLTQRPGRDNATIGNAFVDLIDDAFDNYREFQASNDLKQYTDWATQNKCEVE